MTEPEATPAQFWEDHYARREQVWSGRPNEVLVSEVDGLEPGDALDLGCGEGADAIWLATIGWRVVAVDISTLALQRAARRARETGVEDRIDWLAEDLARWRPDRQFDLVSAQFLHSPIPLPRDAILQAAASAVRVGGTLIVIGHGDVPPWAPAHHSPVHLPTSADVLTALAVTADEWQVERCDASSRAATGPDGQPGTLLDQVLRLRRL